MSVTAAEFTLNLNKYLELAETEDIYISRDGKIIAKLSNPHSDRVEAAMSLLGTIPAELTLEEARDERISRI